MVAATSQAPDRFEAWRAHMRAGTFKDAWRISDQVLAERQGKRCEHLPLHQRWLWDGRSIVGEPVLIRCYHGLGDTIQFMRYLPMVKQTAQRVEIAIQPELLELARLVPGIDRIHVAGAPLQSDDFAEVEIMELAHLFRSTLTTLPRRVPYFAVEASPLSPSGAELNIGLVWSAGSGWDRRRSVSADALEPLMKVPGTRFYILQQGCGGNLPFGCAIAQRDSIVDLARLMRALDLVITVDSMPAHLAGALGVPVWTLLHADADWRWMTDRDDSPWYPTMRLFRQKRAGDWSQVIQQVAGALAIKQS